VRCKQDRDEWRRRAIHGSGDGAGR
jgi:hypothetical protein